MLFTFSGNSKKQKSIITSLLLITLLITPILLLLNSQPASAAETVITPKWSRSGLGTNWEGGLVIGDVTGDGSEDIVYAGGGSDTIYVLNGATGATIATYYNSRIGTYCQPQLYDVDGDGVLDILVPLYSRPGLAVVKYDGSSTLRALWVRDTQGTGGSGSCMSKPVAGDINGDGHVEIYIASQDVSPAYNRNNSTGQPILDGYDGTVTMFDYQGNIVAQNFNWRSCSGGLSLADTNNDGEFELYMGDRDMYYGDGNYGKGTVAYWAKNLTIIWDRLDFLSSSQAPVLVDVNGDGILDVLSGMYREMNIENSSNGAIMQKWSGGSLNVMSVHYGFTVYDIDGDGHLELLCSDGDHDNDPYADVIDLVTGRVDAELPLAGGDTKWSPVVADISPTQPGMEIISVPNGTTLETGYWRGAIMIFNSQFQSLQNVTRFNGATLGSQLAYPIIQDIDGDGLLELVTHASSGTIYAFDTQGPKPAQRIRSEVTYYGEKRTGVARYEIPPWGPNYWVAPIVAPVSPGNDALAVPITASQLVFSMREHQGQTVSYTVTSSPNIGSASGTSIGNPYNWNNYTVNITPGSLAYDTTYTWTVRATDGTYNTTKTYSFHTALAPAPAGNNPPTQTAPQLISTDGLNTTTSTFVAANQTTTDPNGNPVTNIYRWLVNGVPAANLQLPFNLRSSTSTKDYAYGNNGIVKGATWVPNGIVGGAYSFDGQNDAIIISDGGKGYYDNKTYADNQPELGGGGTWTQLTVEAWINLRAYNTGSRIVAKIPSYELGFQSGSSNTLMATVWPKTGNINYDDDNHASSDRARTVTAPVNLQLNRWYHIAFTYKSGEGLKLYLNGQLVAQRTASGPLEDSYGESIYIGRLVEPFNGLIDEVSIYPYAQTAQQIANSYQNMVGGSSSNAQFIPVGAAEPGNTLTCQVIPTDSFTEGNTASSSVIVTGSKPIASNLEIYPARESLYRLSSENLTASYVYYQADGFAESGSQIRWYRNGVLQSQFNNQLQVPATSISAGQNWSFTVTPRDITGNTGDLKASYNVTIRSNNAPTTGTPSLTSVNGNLVATAQGTTDANGDSTTNIYRWLKNGNSITNLQLSFDTETPRIQGTSPVTHDYSGYNNNGAVIGSSWTRQGLVGAAYNFDGDDYISVQENGGTLGADGGWSKLSLEFWVKANETTTGGYFPWILFAMHDSNFSALSYPGTFFPYGLSYKVDFRATDTNNQVTWSVYTSSGEVSTSVMDIDGSRAWHHIACTYESGVGLKIYVDGVMRASVYGEGTISPVTDDILDIGGTGGSGLDNYGPESDFKGMLDEVRIYPSALSASQVLQRYLETKDGLSSSNTIAAQETTEGEIWRCQVIPNDAWQDGTAVNSQSITIGGTEQYALTVNIDGDGTVNKNPNQATYSYGTNVTLTATANTGASFLGWSGDASGTELTVTINMTSDKAVTARFTTTALPPVFQDGFESGTFNAWSSTTRTTGETTSIASNVVHGGSYSAAFTSSGDGGYERAYASRSGLNLGEVYAKAYVYVDQSGIADNSDRFYFIQLLSGGNILAYGGWRQDASGNLLWHIMIRDGTNTVGAYSTVAPSTGAWYLVELHWKADTANGLGELYVNGNLVASISDSNTANYGNATIARFGLPEIYNCASTTAYIDDVAISISASGQDPPPPPPVNYQLTVGLTGSGSTSVTGTNTYAEGTSVPVLATASTGWQFDHWLLNGTNVGSTNPYSVNMNANYVLTAVFIQSPSSIVFADGFESGNFNAWTATGSTSGETANVNTNPVYQGSYSARFTSNGDGGYEKAYATETLQNPLDTVYVQGTFVLTQNGIVENGDRVKLVELRSGSTIIASAGIIERSSTLRWWLETRDGTSYIETYAQSAIDFSSWFTLELQWINSATNGGATLWVNGSPVIQVNGDNTSNYGGCTEARIGLPEIYNCGNTVLSLDNVVVSTEYVGV